MSNSNPFENELKNWIHIIQDCSINFFIGSGISSPYFSTLGKIEVWLFLP